MTTVNWSNVTLGEFAALDVLRRPDAEVHLNRYWLTVHAANPFRGDQPTRLTDEGRTWLAELQSAVAGTDEGAEIAAAREFLRRMGTLTVMGTKRILP